MEFSDKKALKVLAAPLRKALKEQEDPVRRAWWENYVKESAPFLGVPMATVRSIVRAWAGAPEITGLENGVRVELALALFEGSYTEDKLAGTLYLQEHLIPQGVVRWEKDLNLFAELFDRGLLYDWNVVDWFCVKVLSDLIVQGGPACAEQIAGWHSAENLWRARAALVAFVNHADQPAYDGLIRAASSVLIRREERFAKTAVGWILREISRRDSALVGAFVESNLRYFSKESLDNALKYFPTDSQKDFRRRLRDSH